MTRNIVSEVIGSLQQDEQWTDWWESGAIAIPFFDNKELTIIFQDVEPDHDPAFIDEADRALANFLAQGAEERIAITDLVYKNCMDFLEEVGYDERDEELWNITDKKNIWDFIYPTGIYVTRRPHRDRDIYLNIACECAWEEEHGLQLVFRQGKKLTRISEQDGHVAEADASARPDEEDELLSRF